ncbi:uncharacterized protein LOC123530436 [Mercenaria mercenaria]|uniref:uncharacterized protein LOC123530436 n=1 Tax=Mercenaria mercenaria TaxID=6596 RepID=UPI001E1D4938|nr:uncharacterized protein LOC123530436 [Mercenaria mercenaria]
MTVTLNERKSMDIKQHCEKLLKEKIVTIREFSKLIGKMVAADPGVLYGPLHYKALEIERDRALKLNIGNFDAYIKISEQGEECLKWWLDNIGHVFKPISHGNVDRKIETDSSMTGYGGHDTTFNRVISGHWSSDDKKQHINYLELKAAFLCLQFFCGGVQNEHVQLYLDNTVAIKYLSKMGGRKMQLNELTREIWEWCEKRNIWLSAYHIPGKLNTTADTLSRMSKKLNDDMEWSLHESVFNCIQEKMGTCSVDLFASAANHKLDQYVSYVPEGHEIAVNAFSLSWSKGLNYIFPPFSLLGKVLQKVTEDQAEAILVAPIFTTQPWFPRLLQMICSQSYILPRMENLLTSPRKKNHPLVSMKMGVFRISGNILFVQDYQKSLQKSSWRLGDGQRKISMGHISKNGCVFVVKNKLIQLNHL